MSRMAWAELRRAIEKEAPGDNIHAVPFTIVNAGQVLEDAEVDQVIGNTGVISNTFRAEYLFSPIYICIIITYEQKLSLVWKNSLLQIIFWYLYLVILPNIPIKLYCNMDYPDALRLALITFL